MERFNFGLSVSTDRETGETLAVYFRIRNGQVAETKKFADGYDAIFGKKKSSGSKKTKSAAASAKGKKTKKKK